MEWKPIETVPTEPSLSGHRVLLWMEDTMRGPVFGRVHNVNGLPPLVVGEGFNGDWKYTHWMPLPEAPK